MEKITTQFGIIEVEPGKSFEPIYKAKEIDGTVVAASWFCPHCGMEFKSRKSCKKHCAGQVGMFVATCAYLPQHQCNENCRRRWHPNSKYAEFF